jgi:hypothetical protein
LVLKPQFLHGVFVLEFLVGIVRNTFEIAAQAFGTFLLAGYRLALDLMSLAFGTCM